MHRYQLGGLGHIQAVVPKLVGLRGREIAANRGCQQHASRGLGSDIGNGVEDGSDGLPGAVKRRVRGLNQSSGQHRIQRCYRLQFARPHSGFDTCRTTSRAARGNTGSRSITRLTSARLVTCR